MLSDIVIHHIRHVPLVRSPLASINKRSQISWLIGGGREIMRCIQVAPGESWAIRACVKNQAFITVILCHNWTRPPKRGGIMDCLGYAYSGTHR